LVFVESVANRSPCRKDKRSIVIFVYSYWVFMNKNFLAFILSFTFLSLFAQKEKDCSLRYNENGVKVYACFNEQSKYKSIRAELILKASYIELETFIRNVPHYLSWQ